MNSETFKMKQESEPMVFIINDFYDNVENVRDLALKTHKRADIRYWKGRRSQMLDEQMLDHIKKRFEKIIGRKFSKIQSHFQVCDVEDPLVYHCDQQQWAGAVYLTPDAPPECGTSLWKSKRNGMHQRVTAEECQKRGMTHKELQDQTFGDGALLDKTKWTEIDRLGNVYNRCTLWQGGLIHSCSGYFGHKDEDRRLFQLFFLWE